MTAAGTGAATANRGAGANTGGVYGNITVGANRYVLEPVADSPPAVSATMPPSRLLAARYQVVDFHGRDSELASLGAWRDNAAPAVAVRLVHGPGGQGKTRLAARFTQASRQAGWLVCTARHSSTLGTSGGPGAEPGPGPGARGLLVVIDYAERWPTTDL